MNNMMEGNIFNQDEINSKNEKIMNLLNKNDQMAKQIEINNNIIKNIMRDHYSDYNFEEDEHLLMITNLDLFPSYNKQERKINIIFELTNGFKTNLVVPLNAKMKELLVAFHIKLQLLGEKIVKQKIENLKDYHFLFNSRRIYLDENETVYNFGMTNQTEKVIVSLKEGIIGGK